MASTLPNMSLKTWNLGTDYFSYNELVENWQKVDNHDHSSGKGVQIPEAGIANGAITSNKVANGAIVGAKLAANTITNDRIATSDLQKLGLSDSTPRRGKAIITATESRTNTGYGTLTTPDQVSGIVLPTDGLIFVLYQATWEASTTTPDAAVFVGANQAKIAYHTVAAPAVVGSNGSNFAAGTQAVLYSGPGGLASRWGTSYTGDVTTGQLVGNGVGGEPEPGVIPIFAAAGTYTVSVQFKVASGSVTVKDRKLWVWTMGF